MAPKRIRQRRSGPAFPLTVIQAVALVVAYGRVSSDQQRDDETINIQVTKLEGTIKVRDNPELPLKDRLQLVGSFYDNGVSGTLPLEQRPEGRKLMERICTRESIKCEGDCRGTGEVNQVWITKLDRLARKLQILVDIEAWLRCHNVSLICMDPAIDTSTFTGRLVFTILAAIAEWEREAILERTTNGKHQKASEGKWVGGRKTFGLTTDEDGHLVVDETLVSKTGEMAYQMVQSVFDNIALHKSNVGKEARRTGLSERRIGIMLHNPRYKGEGGIYAKDGTFTAAEKNPPPALVSPERWQLAQDMLVANRARAGGNPRRTYLLSGLLTCCEPYEYISTVDDEGRTRERPSNKIDGVCGRSFSGRHHSDNRDKGGRDYAYYFCTRTLKRVCAANEAGCTAKMLPAARADEAIWKLVKRFVSNPGDLLAEADSSRGEMLAEITRALTDVIDMLSRAQAERDNVLVSVERGFRTWDTAEMRLSEIDHQIQMLERQRDAFEVQVRSLNYESLDDQRSAVAVPDVIHDLDAIERDNDVTLKKALIQAVVRRIEVRSVDGKARMRVHMRFGGDAGQLMTQLRLSSKGQFHHQVDTQQADAIIEIAA